MSTVEQPEDDEPEEVSASDAARVLSVLLVTPPDSLEGFRTRVLGKKSTLSLEHLRLTREVLQRLGTLLFREGDPAWERLPEAQKAITAATTGIPAATGEAATPAPVDSSAGAVPAPAAVSANVAPQAPGPVHGPVSVPSPASAAPSAPSAAPPPAVESSPGVVRRASAPAVPAIVASPAPVAPPPAAVSSPPPASMSSPPPAAVSPPPPAAVRPSPAMTAWARDAASARQRAPGGPSPWAQNVAPASMAPASVAPAPVSQPDPQLQTQADEGPATSNALPFAHGDGSAAIAPPEPKKEFKENPALGGTMGAGAISPLAMMGGLPFAQKKEAPKNASESSSTSTPAQRALSVAPELTLEQYASLNASCKEFPDRVAATYKQYGIEVPAVRNALHEQWRQRFEREPPLRTKHDELVAHYATWMRNNPG